MSADLPDPFAAPAGAAALLALLAAAGWSLALKDAADGRYVWADAGWAAQLGLADPMRPLAGCDDAALLPAAEAALWRAADQRALAAAQPVEDSHHFEREGRRVELQGWRSRYGAADGRALLLCALRPVAREATEARLGEALQQVERLQGQLVQVRQAASGDRPGELFRRDHFEAMLSREAALSRREGREFALVLIAVDHHGELEARHGEAGLALLVDTLQRLMRANTRAMDALAQLGPARFAILFSGIGLAIAHGRVEQLRRACAAELLVLDGQPWHFEISAGVASFPHTADRLDLLSQAAIRALNEARQRGGNRVVPATISLSDLPGGR